MYPEYIPLEVEHVLPTEEQPLPPVDLPTAESPGYVAESDPEEDPKESEDNETEDGLVDYPMDGGDDGDDEDGDLYRDDADDKDKDEEDEEEGEEEHLALADSTVVIPTVELVSPPEGTETVIPPPSTHTATYGARITDVPLWGIRFFGMEQPDSPEAAPQSPILTPPVPQDEDEHEQLDPEEDPEEYEDDETEDGSVDYPMDRGDDRDDDDGDSSGDDADDEDEDEEEEEHLALADFANVIPTDELVFPPEGTYPVRPPPFTDTTTTGARITIRLQAAICFLLEAKLERLLAMPTPPPSPFASLSPPFAREHLARCMASSACPSPPHMPLTLLPSSGCLTQIQTLKLASTQALTDAVTAAIPSPPLPPPLYIPLPVDRMDDILEIEMPPCKREVGYNIRDIRVDPTEMVPEIAPTTIREVNTKVTELAKLHEHDTHDLYALLEDAQDSRTRISQRVAMDSQRVDLLMEDRIAHQETILIMEEEAYAARKAWAHSI
nr:hypothetical protein [Tanacetum cinerariifolium]